MLRRTIPFFLLVLITLSCKNRVNETVKSLRYRYSQPPSEWPSANVDEGIIYEELGSLPEVTYPADNPYSKQKSDLGKALFFDPRLSRSGMIACASCHDSELGWADGKQRSFGHERARGARNAMSILNVAYFEEFFWDGRAHSLEDQARFPVSDIKEMNMDLAEMVKRLNGIEGYRLKFKEVFDIDSIELIHVQKAIATFERGIVSRDSRFDRFVKGDTSALNESELRGLNVFRTNGRCMNCHNGPLFTDGKYHNLGQALLGTRDEDLGRYHATGDTLDAGKFRTPSLRDVIYTGPYFHNGGIAELREILDMYERGMPHIVRKNAETSPFNIPKSQQLRPLTLSDQDKEDLLAFLEAISVRPYRMTPPELPQ